MATPPCHLGPYPALLSPTLPYLRRYTVCLMRPGSRVTWPWLCLSMIHCCVQILWSQICVTCQRYCFRFGRPVLLCRGKMPRARWMAACVRDGYEHFANLNLSVVVVKCCFLGCVAWDRTLVVRRFVAFLKNISNFLYINFCDLNSIFPSIQLTALFKNVYLCKLSSCVTI